MAAHPAGPVYDVGDRVATSDPAPNLSASAGQHGAASAADLQPSFSFNCRRRLQPHESPLLSASELERGCDRRSCGTNARGWRWPAGNWVAGGDRDAAHHNPEMKVRAVTARRRRGGSAMRHPMTKANRAKLAGGWRPAGSSAFIHPLMIPR